MDGNKNNTHTAEPNTKKKSGNKKKADTHLLETFQN